MITFILEWGENTYQFPRRNYLSMPNFNGATVEVWDWVGHFISHHKIMYNYLSALGLKSIHVSKRCPWPSAASANYPSSLYHDHWDTKENKTGLVHAQHVDPNRSSRTSCDRKATVSKDFFLKRCLLVVRSPWNNSHQFLRYYCVVIAIPLMWVSMGLYWEYALYNCHAWLISRQLWVHQMLFPRFLPISHQLLKSSERI